MCLPYYIWPKVDTAQSMLLLLLLSIHLVLWRVLLPFLDLVKEVLTSAGLTWLTKGIKNKNKRSTYYLYIVCVTEPRFVCYVTCSLSELWQTIRPGARSQRGETGVRRRQRQSWTSLQAEQRYSYRHNTDFFSFTFCICVCRTHCVYVCVSEWVCVCVCNPVHCVCDKLVAVVVLWGT